jgi:thiosulfate/3-mercaptopyruvate sulfurtransferase
VDYDPRSNYSLGHIPGAVLFDWKQDINDPVRRNVLSKQACEELLQRAGLNNNTTLILYADFNNWFAAFESYDEQKQGQGQSSKSTKEGIMYA